MSIEDDIAYISLRLHMHDVHIDRATRVKLSADLAALKERLKAEKAVRRIKTVIDDVTSKEYKKDTI